MTLRAALGVAIWDCKLAGEEADRSAASVLQRFRDVGLPEIERLSIEVTSGAMGSEQISRTIAAAIGKGQ